MIISYCSDYCKWHFNDIVYLLIVAPGEVMSEADRQQQLQYEEWLMQQSHLLGMQLKYLEQQIAKQRKTKKESK